MVYVRNTENTQTIGANNNATLFDGMSQEELNAIEKQKEEHNKKCNR
jgi:hypothetical protein